MVYKYVCNKLQFIIVTYSIYCVFIRDYEMVHFVRRSEMEKNLLRIY